MAKLNRKIQSIKTHEWAVAKHINAEQMLRRSVLSCLLWEKAFYESGEDIASRIQSLCGKVSDTKISELAIEARSKFNLRHVPLLLAREMARQSSKLTAETLFQIIQRPDELTEFLAIYWKDGKCPVSAQVKKGLAKAFTKFSGYQLQKYNRDGAIKLRDVLFLCHAKPKDKEQEALWKRLVNNEMAIPETWETQLSAGKDKKGVFESLMAEKKLGAMAFLRNLRNMIQAGVNLDNMKKNMLVLNISRVLPFPVSTLPDGWLHCDGSAISRTTYWELFAVGSSELDQGQGHYHSLATTNTAIGSPITDGVNGTPRTGDETRPVRFIAAARYAPMMEPEIEMLMLSRISEYRKLPGKTVLLIDVSGSMESPLSSKSDMRRQDAAAGLAIIVDEICEDERIFTFSMDVVEVPLRHGFALSDAIDKSQSHSGTYLGMAVREMNDIGYDRIIVITDEQSHGRVPDPVGKYNYMINVASYRNGVGYGKWTHIDGFSEAVVDYIIEMENIEAD